MSLKAFSVGVLALMSVVPVTAQRRGTIEFGGFGSAASFDTDLSLDRGFGGGGRIGMFLTPTWSIEFEDAEMRVSRPNGLANVNAGLLSGRLVASPRVGGMRVLLGAGAGASTETNFLHSYGVDALAGVKFALGEKAAFRVDGVWAWLANEDWQSHRSVRVGLSLYRHPAEEVRTVTVTEAAPPARRDTIVVTREVAAAPPNRTAAQICVATGETISALVTAQGDTLVGPTQTSIRALRSEGASYTGDYAERRNWFDQDLAITFEARSFQKSGNETRLDCPDIRRVGEYQGVALFARLDAAAPYQQLYMPVRPGVWQMYESLRGTRG